MNDTGVKQQIVESIKNADTVLVTVGKDSSVDELSAALGTTLYLNEINKHATAVVSGEIPPAITFLKPEKTFENSVDSLRDFVIALDKEKADHLRYKVEGDVVKIFITPYKTVITQKDLDYSQGDYNVELVLAFGVKDQDQLDTALSAHGRILHDAAVATMGIEPSTLGTMDWNDPEASSLCEMAAELVDTLQADAKPMTEQVASALLTGIVAATDRFSNDNTTSRSMTVAAQLMAKGANQQLIAAKLREGSKIDLPEGKNSKPISANNSDSNQNLSKKKNKKRDDSSLDISHDNRNKTDAPKKDKPEKTTPKETQAPTPESTPAPESKRVVEAPKDGEPYDPAAVLDAALKKSEEFREEDARRDEEELTRQLEETVAASTPTPNLAEELAAEAVTETTPPAPADTAKEIPAPEQTPAPVEAGPASSGQDETAISTVRSSSNQAADAPQEPHFGGTLNATTEQAAESKRLLADQQRNKTILSHAPGQHVGDSKPTLDVPPFNSVGATDEPPSIDPFKDIQMTSTTTPVFAQEPPASTQAPAEVAQQPTLTQLDDQHRQPETVQQAPTFDPVAPPDIPPAPQPEVQPPQIQAPNTPPPPPTPDFSQLPPLPQMPDFTQLPTVPGQEQGLPPEQPLGEMLPPPAQQSVAAAPADPGQFKIPGQQ